MHRLPDPSRDERDALALTLFRRRLESDDAAERDALTARLSELYLPIARHLARKYSGRGEDHDDLLQVASVGLMKAINGFDPSLEHDFISYASPTIRGELKRYFRDHCWTVRPTRRLQELQVDINAASARLLQEHGREPSRAAVAEELGSTPGEVAEAMIAHHCYSPASIDAARDDDQDPLVQRLGVEDREFNVVETHVTLLQAMRGLSARDREIIGMRFFQGLTQSQIAAEIGTSQVQVSRLLARIMRDMRRSVERTDGAGRPGLHEPVAAAS